jgi:hypothetical protein
MIEIDITTALADQYADFSSDEFVEVVLDDIAAGARAHWMKLAQRQLNTSKADYIDSIQEVQGSGEERYIALVGWLANAVENGLDPFDLRDTLLNPKNPKVKRAKDGSKYRPIPFRHQTPGTQGSAGRPMGERYGPLGDLSVAWASKGLLSQSEAVKLGKKIYNKAKKLEGKQRLKTSETKRRGFIQVPKLAPWHKSDIYRGMIKDRAPYKKVDQTGGYTTFRTISERNPEGWIHPGIQARRLMDQVEPFVKRISEDIIRTAWDNAMGGKS